MNNKNTRTQNQLDNPLNDRPINFKPLRQAILIEKACEGLWTAMTYSSFFFVGYLLSRLHSAGLNVFF